MGQLRIAPTISGAVSLGAYEGGALAALLVAIQALQAKNQDAIRIDAIGGASAGCMTGVLVAKILSAGLDPVANMYQAWVEAASLDNLKTSTGNGPLTMDNLIGTLKTIIALPIDAKKAQTASITVRGIICCLRGFDYEIRGVSQDVSQDKEQERHIDAVTFIDWSTFTFHSDGTIDPPGTKWLDPGGPVEIALASGSNAMGFPPRALDRSGEPWTRYKAEDAKNLPGNTQTLWFTDGGTLDNEPLGHTLDLTNDLDLVGKDPLPSDGVRLHLLIHPHPAPAESGDAWVLSPTFDPSWDVTLVRAGKLIATQSLYDDLNRVAKSNSRIRWTAQLGSVLADLLHQLDQPTQDKWEAALSDFVSKVRDDKDHLGRSSGAGDVAGNLEDAIGAALGESSGFGRKQAVEVDVVSPLILGRQEPVADLLAGEFLFAFGGFLDIRLRQSDFALGYMSMQKWLADNLGRLTGLDVAAVLAAVDAAKHPECNLDPVAGSTPWSRVTAWERVEALAVAAHFAKIAIEG
jgi:predicted acylesterase/phospholipase RssA